MNHFLTTAACLTTSACLTASACVLLLAGSLGAADRPAPKSGAETTTATLDGRRFSVQFTDAAGAKQDTDTIEFRDGRLVLPGIAKRYGFAAGTYRVASVPGGSTITATLVSDKHGQVEISQSIPSSAKPGQPAISGTRTWTKGGKDAIVHQLTGTVSSQKSP